MSDVDPMANLVTMSLTMGFKSVYTSAYESERFIRGAKVFAKNALHYENNPEIEDASSLHHYMSVASLLYSAFFLEARINEYIFGCSDKTLGYYIINEMSDGQRQQIAQLVKPNSTDVLTKYGILLSIMSNQPYDKAAEPYQSVAQLIVIRNAFVHFQMQQKQILKDGVATTDLENLEKKLLGRFTLSPFTHSGSNFFPDRLPCYSSAKWAHNAAADFVSDFYTRTIPHPLCPVPEKI